MISFFGDPNKKVYAVLTQSALSAEDVDKLVWLFNGAPYLNSSSLQGHFRGPRAAMISPWSTNAVEITQNMCISGIHRIEEFFACSPTSPCDPLLAEKFDGLHQDIFRFEAQPEPVLQIEDIAAYNLQEGLALNEDEVQYLESLAKKLGRALTDSEVFGFSQVNSEHCRHKIFNGTYTIDGKLMPDSLFQLIKKTSKEHPNEIVSAYKDNVAFINGPSVEQFAPNSFHQPDYYIKKPFDSVISLKAETHNFPTTVEPFNGAATGSGGEIRDRLAGGQGSIPLAGTAVYMTPYPRLEKNRSWEENFKERNWLYQTPKDILIKASNGASDFGNKFGQPLITGSLLTFEHITDEERLGFDKVIMLAGGVGYAKHEQALKQSPDVNDDIILMGGENYRIGMGGAAVSSADTGSFGSGIELNAVQRSNPEMQKRVANAIRSMVESDQNPIKSIHDHGAGGHLNCLSELVETTGGVIDIKALPVGDASLSHKEIIGNESQERMGLVMDAQNTKLLQQIAERERAPIYKIGKVTGDHRFVFRAENTQNPIDLDLIDFFGNTPKMQITDKNLPKSRTPIDFKPQKIYEYTKDLLQLEAVACKDWLTNKVDRCVGGKTAKQQTCGPLQLPLNNVGVMAIDFTSKKGIATSIGHSPVSALINPEAGSRNSIAEALTNLVFAPLTKGLKGVSLSANWMWPCGNAGEDARLYKAVQAASDFAIELGINIPTGKDSLSMKQKYPDGDVLAPGTVIISTVGECVDIEKIVEPVLQKNATAPIYYINMSSDQHRLGGSSFAQLLNQIGNETPTIKDAEYFKQAFGAIQQLINSKKILAGHDIGSGGLITSLLELCFADNNLGASLDLSAIGEPEAVLFAENCAVVLQATDASVEAVFNDFGVTFYKLGYANNSAELSLQFSDQNFRFSIPEYRDYWYKTSYLLDKEQTQNNLAEVRYNNYKNQALNFNFPAHFDGTLPSRPTKRPKAAIIREKGSNSEREMAHAMYLAGFDVKDVHMTDLIAGRETLQDIQFIGAVGGFSNSDVLGSARGWAGAFLYNDRAQKALSEFFKREDTLSVGICNGCQLFINLDLIHPELPNKSAMLHNDSGKHECQFTSVKIQKNNAVMLHNLAGSTLGVWISHGEGKFSLPEAEEKYHIVAKYAYAEYPSNPNGSDYNTAMLCDKTGRHLVMMPHIERSIFPWNWAYYPAGSSDEVSPWLTAFINARQWIEQKNAD